MKKKISSLGIRNNFRNDRNTDKSSRFSISDRDILDEIILDNQCLTVDRRIDFNQNSTVVGVARAMNRRSRQTGHGQLNEVHF
jgi:hypothetical protein